MTCVDACFKEAGITRNWQGEVCSEFSTNELHREMVCVQDHTFFYFLVYISHTNICMMK